VTRVLHHRVAALCATLFAFVLVACTAGTTSSPAPSTGKPNIVFVLTDDLSWNLVQYLPHVQQLQQSGRTFTNYFVTDSLCCPSRSSIFAGQYPHDTGVFTNNGDDGGFAAYQRNGDEQRSFALALQAAGYRTGFMGKYLNGYQPTDPLGTARPYVPPGWNEWDGAGNAYAEYNYDLNENGTVHHYGKDPQDYLTDVLSHKATEFIDSSTALKTPFMLEVATFAPHQPATPAARDENSFPNLTAPRSAAYGAVPTAAPPWLAQLPPLTPKADQDIDELFAKRVRSMQAVDDMIGALQQQLQVKGLADNTYFVFSSDNGFHLGEHQLRAGKQTAFDTDIRVPLIVAGPGVAHNQQTAQLAENIDLNPTFVDLAGSPPASAVDGRSLLPLLRGQQVPDWRQAVLIEHHHPPSKKNDPDAADRASGDPPSYAAIRTADAAYVEYTDGEREYYDLAADPDELHNLAATPPGQLKTAQATLHALTACHGAESCWSAAHLRQ